MEIETIHESLVNGQREQMARQIDEYGLYGFWSDYEEHLDDLGLTCSEQYDYFCAAVKSYHRITAT